MCLLKLPRTVRQRISYYSVLLDSISTKLKTIKMSLDLLREFGYIQKQALEENPWQQTYSQTAATDIADDDEDDFGDFEGPKNEISSQRKRLNATNVGLLESAEESSAPGSADGKGYQGSNYGLEPPEILPSPIEHEADDWGDFVDQPSEAPCRSNASYVMADKCEGLSQTKSGVALPFQTRLSPKSKPEEPNANCMTPTVRPTSQASPPSNIPPPSILLLLAATLLQSLSSEIKRLTASIKIIYSEPASSNNPDTSSLVLRLAFLRAIARIIAGRKLRWKRDTHLAQSMKIGPAQAGKVGGMKLTGIDRMESRREDQEAAEVVRIWKQYVGSLRACIASVHAQGSGTNLALPDLAENMPVRTAKMGEGALTAPRSCVLCGLKREERVQRADFNVEDSFEEWWADHW